jgi:hypothetical protein
MSGKHIILKIEHQDVPLLGALCRWTLVPRAL